MSVNNTLQQSIINTMLLNASFIDNIGLMNGKMGISIFYVHLAQQTKNTIYEDYAGELIDEIYEEIAVNTSVNFENCLAGIDWGIEHLIHNGFIEADTDEVLEEFDNLIIHEITYHAPHDAGILLGISGYLAYFLAQIKKGSKKKSALKRALLKATLLLQKYIDKSVTDSNHLWKEPEKLDIAWSYLSVLWILTELYYTGICKKETKLIIKKLLRVYHDNSSLPKLDSHRLLFASIIEKLRQLGCENLSDIYLVKLSKQLMAEIRREKIREELERNSAFICNGVSGISAIYQQLFLHNQNSQYDEESLYWKSCCLELIESERGYAGYFVRKEDKNKSFGILKGITGIGLNGMKLFINQTHNHG